MGKAIDANRTARLASAAATVFVANLTSAPRAARSGIYIALATFGHKADRFIATGEREHVELGALEYAGEVAEAVNAFSTFGGEASPAVWQDEAASGLYHFGIIETYCGRPMGRHALGVMYPEPLRKE